MHSWNTAWVTIESITSFDLGTLKTVTSFPSLYKPNYSKHVAYDLVVIDNRWQKPYAASCNTCY